jgi:hypothetical protein
MADLLKLKKAVDAAVKFAKTPFEMAHELAQKRAALPVAMRGLGLPAGNTAEQRAKALGFLGEGYHGSMSDIKKFSTNKASTESHAGRGTYITDSPEDASLNYANIYGPDVMGKVENGLLQLGDDRNPIDRIAKGLQRQTLTPRQQEVLLANTTGADNLGVVYPLRYRSDMPVHLDRPQAKEVRVGPFEHYDEVNDEYIESPLAGKLGDALDEYREYGGDPSSIMDNLADYSGESIPADKLYREIVKAAERSGLSNPETGDIVSGGVAAGDFLRHFGVDEIAHTPDFRNQQLNIGTKHTVSMNPDNIRSRSAAFDPWRINAATAAAMGVAAPDLLAKEPKKKAAGGPVHMQVGGFSKIPSLVRAVGQAASKSKPFYSAVDEAISGLPNKALGDQFVKEMLKRGVKPQEIIDRNLDKILGAPIVQKTRTVNLKKPDAKGRTQIEEKYFEVTPSPKGSKSINRTEVEDAVAKNPAPQIVEREIGDKSFNARVEEITDDLVQDKIDGYESMGESPKNAAWLADSERDDLFKQAHAKVMDEGGYDPQYQRYSTPGGENYREILMKLPNKNLSTKDIAFDMYGKAMAFLTEGEKDAVHAEMRKQFNARPEFKTTHYGGDENILAHARVQDRTGPNGEKILHIEEIQSDWHQKGRKQGYKSPGDERKATSVTDEGGYYEVKDQNGKFIANVMHSDMGKDIAPENALRIANERMSSNAVGRFANDERVPDAPFKKDWQELVLKRLVDDAARNGYHKVVITPGAEQVRRYEKAGTPEGEGLAKWYDEIIPSAVNKLYGKHGVKLGTHDIEGAEGVVPYHSFDITPQLRESITSKGQPLYMAAPLGAAVDSALEQEEPVQQRKGGAVNQDAMNMAVWNKGLGQGLNILGTGDGIAPYGLRHGTPTAKSKGYFGLLPASGGRVSSEISAESDVGEYPLMVPTLNREELGVLLSGGRPTDAIYQKAEAWAKRRQEGGQSPFAGGSDYRYPLPESNGGSVDAMRIAVMNKQLRKQHG